MEALSDLAARLVAQAREHAQVLRDEEVSRAEVVADDTDSPDVGATERSA